MVTWLVWYSSPRARLGKKLPFWLVQYQQFIKDKSWVDHNMWWCEAQSRAQTKDTTDDSRHDILAWIDRNLGQTMDMIYAVYHCIRDPSSVFSWQVISQISKKTKDYLSSKKMITYLGLTNEEECHEIMATLFLEINNHAYPQLDQYQVESVVRILNTHLQVKEDHSVSIAESFPFVNWPMHIWMLPAGQFPGFLVIALFHLLILAILQNSFCNSTVCQMPCWVETTAAGTRRWYMDHDPMDPYQPIYTMRRPFCTPPTCSSHAGDHHRLWKQPLYYQKIGHSWPECSERCS